MTVWRPCDEPHNYPWRPKSSVSPKSVSFQRDGAQDFRRIVTVLSALTKKSTNRPLIKWFSAFASGEYYLPKFCLKISTHKKVSEVRADLVSTMISSLRLLTKAINNIATIGSLVDHFWNKQLNNILDLPSLLIHHRLTPGTSAAYLPATSSWMALQLSSIPTPATVHNQYQHSPTPQYTTQYSYGDAHHYVRMRIRWQKKLSSHNCLVAGRASPLDLI